MGLSQRKKCRHCKELFRPDPRNVKRQEYSGKSECRKASKAASQRRWLEKPENQDYFRCPENTQRVQQWRKVNPGYYRSRPKPKKNALQDDIVSTVRRMQKLGLDIVNHLPQSKGGRHDKKVSYPLRTHPKGAQPLQLGRSPTGP